MYTDLLEPLRDGLTVSSEWDQRIERAIENAARRLLRTYNFPESVLRVDLPIAAAARSVALPNAVGKIHAVVLVTTENGEELFKVLKRQDYSQLPVHGGPVFYYVQGGTLTIDSLIPNDGLAYSVRVFYQTVDPAEAEDWLSTTYSDVLEHQAGLEAAQKARSEAGIGVYSGLVDLDVEVLGRYIPELNFNDLDLRMGVDRQQAAFTERYPS